MDPFVVTSLGRKTYRTRVVRHNLNPVFEEKLVFSVLSHETSYSLNFAVVDRDQFSNNDFVGTANFPVDVVHFNSPEADPETGLYRCPDPPDAGCMPSTESTRRSRFRMPLSRSTSTNSLAKSRNSSQTNLAKLTRTTSNQSVHRVKPTLRQEDSTNSSNMPTLQDDQHTHTLPYSMPPTSDVKSRTNSESGNGTPSVTADSAQVDDHDLRYYAVPLQLKKQERWEDKHKPVLHIRAKYLPYQALRQQFWRAMLRQYDADETGYIDRVELTTMLDTLGSTLRNSTIDSFFARFAVENDHEEILSMDQAVICLEDQLQKTKGRTLSEALRSSFPSTTTASMTTVGDGNSGNGNSGNGNGNLGNATPNRSSSSGTPLNNRSQSSIIPALEVTDLSEEGEEGLTMPTDDLADDDRDEEEHIVEIQECPICHQPRLDKKNSEADIITHIATCASQDWRAVNNIVMGGFVTSSQAQRKWYSKVITKISYGGYRLGANSANILVQDRMTGQINEERMSVYVRLGIRLMYKGLKSREMEKKKSRSRLIPLDAKSNNS